MSFSAAKPLLDDADLEEEAETYSNDGDAINPTDNQSFQLKPLVEMEVIGACRRGRRRGRRNRTQAERLSGAEQRRQSKNSRERRRVENVKNEYAKLQKILGLQDDENSSKEKGKYCKLRILNAAIDRIKELKEILRRADASLKEGAAAPTALPLTTSADLGGLGHESYFHMEPPLYPTSSHTHDTSVAQPLPYQDQYSVDCLPEVSCVQQASPSLPQSAIHSYPYFYPYSSSRRAYGHHHLYMEHCPTLPYPPYTQLPSAEQLM